MTPNIVEAVIYLKRRYAEHSLQFPAFSRDVSEVQYVAVNLKHTLRNQRENLGYWAQTEEHGVGR